MKIGLKSAYQLHLLLGCANYRSQRTAIRITYLRDIFISVVWNEIKYVVLFKEKPVGILAWFIPCRICRLKWKHDTTECGLVCDSLENWVARYFPAPLIIPDICLFLRIIKFFIKNVRPKNN